MKEKKLPLLICHRSLTARQPSAQLVLSVSATSASSTPETTAARSPPRQALSLLLKCTSLTDTILLFRRVADPTAATACTRLQTSRHLKFKHQLHQRSLLYSHVEVMPLYLQTCRKVMSLIKFSISNPFQSKSW
jgi:hypothetical protein